MLVELATFGGGDDWGDEAEEGGYTASESQGRSERNPPPADDDEDYGQDGESESAEDDGDF